MWEWARRLFSCAERIAQNNLQVNAVHGDLTRMSQKRLGYFSDAAALVARPGATMGWVCSRCRVAKKLGQPFSFSSIHFLAKLPSRISERIVRISSRVFWVMILGPAE